MPVQLVPGRAGEAARSFLRNLHDEEHGVRHRIERYFLPRLQAWCREHGRPPGETRVLDCGCGNGLSVECLRNAGFLAYGIDLWRTRLAQWRTRGGAAFCLANATELPFAGDAFDVVLSSGVLEHIGVEERWEPVYEVEALPTQRQQRLRFIFECLRVLRAGGAFYLDHPNGAFPIDFWHPRDARNGPRWHRTSEKFLPKTGEVRELLRAADPGASARALSPAGRFTYRRTARHWYGRVSRAAVERFFLLLRHPPFDRLAGSPLNPYLVFEIRKPRSGPEMEANAREYVPAANQPFAKRFPGLFLIANGPSPCLRSPAPGWWRELGRVMRTK